MTLQGHVKNGVVLLDDGGTLPEGATVRVELVTSENSSPPAEPPTIYESLAPFVGKAEGLPANMSVNLDHYL